MRCQITLNVNGQDHRVEVKTHHTLLQVLRDQLKLYGVREGCGIGMCGACTVLIDGEPFNSCLMLAPMAQGKPIVTIEGLATGDTLDPVQQSFYDLTGFQCSYCTPGMILSSKALLNENPHPHRDEIKEYLAGNLCRCGSHNNIVESVELAAERLAATTAEPVPR